MKNIPSKPYLPDFLDPFFKLSSYVRADNSNNLAFCVASVEDTSGIRGRIPHTQVDPHNQKPVFGLEEAAHMFKAMPVREISLAQLFVWLVGFFCRSFFTGIEYLRAQCSTV